MKAKDLILSFLYFLIFGNISVSVEQLARDISWCKVSITQNVSFDGFVAFNSSIDACVTCENVTAVYKRSKLPLLSCCNGAIQLSENCRGNFLASCDKTRRIQRESLCDGVKDCIDGRDEVICPPCSTGQMRDKFRCSADQCIELEQICDGKKDCFNGLDETKCLYSHGYCDAFRCSSEIAISSGKYRIETCIDKTKICDLNKDCLNGMDEVNCVKQHQTGYRCSETKDIPMNQVCDGISQCDQHQDEQGCYVWSQWSSWSGCFENNHNFTTYRERTRLCLSRHSGYTSKCTGDSYRRWNVFCTPNPPYETTSISSTTVSNPSSQISNAIKAVIALSSILLLILIVGVLYWCVSTVRRNQYIRNNQLPHVLYAPSVDLDHDPSEISSNVLHYGNNRDSGVDFSLSNGVQHHMFRPSPSILLVPADREVVENPIYNMNKTDGTESPSAINLLHPIIKRLSIASQDGKKQYGKQDTETDELLEQEQASDENQFSDSKLVIVQTENSIEILRRESLKY